MGALLASPAPYLTIAALVAAEWLALAVLRARTGRGVPIPELSAFLGAGALLFLALAAATAQRGSGYVGAALIGALVCHAWLLGLLWRR